VFGDIRKPHQINDCAKRARAPKPSAPSRFANWILDRSSPPRAQHTLNLIIIANPPTRADAQVHNRSFSYTYASVQRGVAQPGSAPALGDQGSQYRTKILADFPARFLLEFGQRGVAQPGSAPALGAGGPRFESGHPDHHHFIRLHGGFFLPCISACEFPLVAQRGVAQPPSARVHSSCGTRKPPGQCTEPPQLPLSTPSPS
jgi:hypothetical protein